MSFYWIITILVTMSTKLSQWSWNKGYHKVCLITWHTPKQWRWEPGKHVYLSLSTYLYYPLLMYISTVNILWSRQVSVRWRTNYYDKAKTVYGSRATSCWSGVPVAQLYIFFRMFYGSLCIFYYFFWPFYCLSFDLRCLINPQVYPMLSY